MKSCAFLRNTTGSTAFHSFLGCYLFGIELIASQHDTAETLEDVGGILDLGCIVRALGENAKPRETDEKPLKSMLSVFLSER